MKINGTFQPIAHFAEGCRGIKNYLVLLFIISMHLASADLFALDVPANKESDSLKQVLTNKLSPRDKINTLAALGKALYMESDLDNALKTESDLLEYISKHGTKADSAKCIRLIGLVYIQKAWYDKALENLMWAQQLFGEAGDSAMQAKALMNVGIVHDCMNNYPMSLSYYNKALDFFARNNNDNGRADCQLNIAIVLAKQKNYEAACASLLSAASIYLKKGNDSYLAAAYINLGLTYKKMKKFDLAIEYLNKALAIWEKEDDQYHICYYHLNMGEIMLDMKKPDDAAPFLLQAEKRAKSLDDKDLQAKAYEYLSDYYAVKKNFDIAYSYLNKSKQLNDSILNAETTEKVNQIEYRYEITKREVENDKLEKQNLSNKLELKDKNMTLYILSAVLVIIALLVLLLVKQNRLKHKANQVLETKNNLIGFQKDELIKLNASKDKFLSILAHDIKNPLSSIYSISDLLVKEYDELSAEEKTMFTKDIHTLSANLFEIINTLLTWSSAQSGLISHHPKPFLISDLCQKTISHLTTVAKQKDITLISNAEQTLSVMADENMIYSVLHNLINNAIKFSNPGAEVLIETAMVDGFAEISVIDKGMGLSAGNIAKLFYYDQHFISKGTAGESGTGLGLILCKDFVEMNGGKIRAESAINMGSTFVFTLPLA